MFQEVILHMDRTYHYCLNTYMFTTHEDSSDHQLRSLNTLLT